MSAKTNRLGREGSLPASVSIVPAILAIAVIVASPGAAIAQDQPSTSAAPTEEIIVTGTRIKTSDLTAAEPVTVVTSARINETKAINLEQFLQKMPSIDFNALGANNNNGGFGASEAAIHDLGFQRTLVLVNGFRYVATDTQSLLVGVDLNNIPVPMVDHIEILRDGASSTYGADAIAGVINVITKKNFVGFQVDGGYGVTDKSDGTQYNGSATLGFGEDRYNLTINLTYDHREPIAQKDRDWATRQFLDSSGRLLDPSLGPTNGRPPGLLLFDPDTRQRRYFGGIHDNLVLQPGDRFDTTSIPYLIGEEERKQVSLVGRYEVTDDITAIAEGFYTNRTSREKLAPEPIDFQITTLKHPDGFFLPYCLYDDPSCAFGVNPNAIRAGVTSDQLARTRRFEGGPRIYRDDIDTYRLRVGFEGRLLDDYAWQIGYVYGRSEAQYRVTGNINLTRFYQLAGLIPCAGEAGCHVANIVGDDTLTPAEIAYVQFANTRTSEVAQDYAYGDITGPVPLVPELQGGPIAFSLGYEYRTESTFDNPDPVIVAGDGTYDAAPSRGSYTVAAGYVEFRAPLFKDLPWIKALTLTGSVRYDDNNVFGGATTWKANVDYAPTDDVRFRITRATGVRAPSIKELFGGIFPTETEIDDPCDTGAGASAGSANCVRDLDRVHADPATFTSSQAPVNTINHGTPTLRPEDSQAWDVGIVLTPRWLPGFSLSVDYWNVLIRNQIIDGLDPQQIVNDCYDPAIASGAACTSITRRPGTGEFVLIDSPNVNFGFEHSQGVDAALSYVVSLREIGIDGPETLTVNGESQYLMHDTVYNALGTAPFDQAGTWQISSSGGEFSEPRWKALVNLTYSEEDWSASVTERYNGGVTALGGTPGDLGNNAPGVFYTDIALTYRWTDTAVTLGIDNLLDKSPPFLNDQITNSLTNGGYDYVGRFLYAKVRWKI